MDIGKAFGFVQQDERWLSKILIGGLISLIPLVGTFIVMGYALRVAQRVARGQELPLPEWDDFGGDLKRGFFYLVIILAYELPLLLIFGLAMGCSSALIGSGGEEGGPLTAVGGVAIIVLSILFIPLALLTALVAYVALARYAATDSLSEALKFRDAIATLRQNARPVLMLLLLLFLASLVASLGMIACFIGVIFTSVYAYIVMAHGIGQLARQLGLARPYSEPAPPYTPPPASF